MTKRRVIKNDAGRPYCEEKQRLSEDFVAAAHQLVALQSQQTEAVIAGDPDFARFDDLLHMAREKKDNAKYGLIAHIEEHRC
jgi:hypothetical protein